MTDNQNSNSTPVLPEGFDDFMAYNKSVLERIGVALRDTESFINPDISIVGRPLSGYSDHSEEIGLLVQSIVESNARLAEIAHEANLQSQLERKENRKRKQVKHSGGRMALPLLILLLVLLLFQLSLPSCFRAYHTYNGYKVK